MNRSELVFPREPARFDLEDFNRLLRHAKAIEASDIHIKTLARVMCRVHGRMVPVTNRRLEDAEVSTILQILYGAANAELEVRTGKALDNSYRLMIDRDAHLRFRWNAHGCEVQGAFGIKITMRELPAVPPRLPKEDLGEAVVKALYPDDGLVLICGATGSGKSTLLAGIITEKAEQADADCNILTLESPVEFTFDKVIAESCMITQSAIPQHLPSFFKGAENTLRGDPDIIVVGEVRDAATIETAVLASQTGHHVLATVHSNTVGTTFLRLTQSLPEGKADSILGSLIDSIRLIICQRLYPSPDGRRVAVRETLVFDRNIRRELLLTATRNIAELPAVADEMVRRHGQTMLAHAEQLVAAGRLDPMYVEVLRADEQFGRQRRGPESLLLPATPTEGAAPQTISGEQFEELLRRLTAAEEEISRLRESGAKPAELGPPSEPLPFALSLPSPEGAGPDAVEGAPAGDLISASGTYAEPGVTAEPESGHPSGGAVPDSEEPGLQHVNTSADQHSFGEMPSEAGSDTASDADEEAEQIAAVDVSTSEAAGPESASASAGGVWDAARERVQALVPEDTDQDLAERAVGGGVAEIEAGAATQVEGLSDQPHQEAGVAEAENIPPISLEPPRVMEGTEKEDAIEAALAGIMEEEHAATWGQAFTHPNASSHRLMPEFEAPSPLQPDDEVVDESPAVAGPPTPLSPTDEEVATNPAPVDGEISITEEVPVAGPEDSFPDPVVDPAQEVVAEVAIAGMPRFDESTAVTVEVGTEQLPEPAETQPAPMTEAVTQDIGLVEEVARHEATMPQEPIAVFALPPLEITEPQQLLGEICDALTARLELEAPEWTQVQMAGDFIKSISVPGLPQHMQQHVRVRLKQHLEATSETLALRLAGESVFNKQKSGADAHGAAAGWELVRRARQLAQEPFIKPRMLDATT